MRKLSVNELDEVNGGGCFEDGLTNPYNMFFTFLRTIAPCGVAAYALGLYLGCSQTGTTKATGGRSNAAKRKREEKKES